MFKRTGLILTIGFASLTLIGSGCITEPVQSITPEEAATSLSLLVGDTLSVKPTVLGVSGQVVGWLGGEDEPRVITLTQWEPGNIAALDWVITHQVETDTSIQTRETYDTQYAEVPIGVDIPEEPEPEYEELTESGSVRTQSLADASTLLLPEYWLSQDMGTVNESLLWISSAQYDELVNTRKANISLGLFDESLARIEETTDKLSTVTDDLKNLLAPLAEYGLWEASDTPPEDVQAQADQDLITVQADGDWSTYYVKINGERTGVRAIKASNAFATYKILANPDNPLVLEIQLTPLSQGNLDLGSIDLIDGFGGYEITEITKTQSE
ncbi:MAG: hypothetical protein P8J32_08140 [bacterium]|jgi:hypothetical protein|nr:hypothetical protein [bacterium]